MRPLRGEFYVNLFAHYRPKGDPAWFTKSNPEDAPQPLLDIGSCSSDNGATPVCTGGHALPFLSNSLDQLLGSSELFSYWQRVSPSSEEVFDVRNKHAEWSVKNELEADSRLANAEHFRRMRDPEAVSNPAAENEEAGDDGDDDDDDNDDDNEDGQNGSHSEL